MLNNVLFVIPFCIFPLRFILDALLIYLRANLDFEKNVKRGLIFMYGSALILEVIRNSLFQLWINSEEDEDHSIIVNILMYSGLFFVVMLALFQSYIDIKLSHFIFILQAKELRWTLLNAQGSTAVILSFSYAIFNLCRDMTYQTIKVQDDKWLELLTCITMISLIIIFLVWSYRATKAIARDQVTIEYILKSNQKREEAHNEVDSEETGTPKTRQSKAPALTLRGTMSMGSDKMPSFRISKS